MGDMLRAINRFYGFRRGPEPSARESMLFVSSRDAALGRSDAGLYLQVPVRVQVMAYNVSEFLRACIKRRSPAYKTISRSEVAFAGDAVFNFPNGTVVIVRRREVDKFYFKDLDFFHELYGNVLQGGGAEAVPGDGFLVWRQPRFQPLDSGGDGRTLLAADPALKGFHARCDGLTRADLFSVEYKVRQLLAFYGRGKNDPRAYLEICSRLGQKAGGFGAVLCHGDLWKGNVLNDPASGAALIDFDKAVLFCPAYDYVYYYLMAKVLPFRRDLDDLLVEMTRHVRGAQAFLREECRGWLGDPGSREIEICIFLFTFLKLVERDARHEECGRSVPRLLATLESMG